MVFFILGYLITAAALVLQWHVIEDVFVGPMFALGALFVYLGVTIQARLVGQIVQTMERLVPICASCKRLRLADRDPDDMASWKAVEAYLAETHQAKVSHGICPECAARLYPGYQKRKTAKGEGGGA